MASSATQNAEPGTRYKRKLTEARREQNRRAQKIWRERQRRQRDENFKSTVLEHLAQEGRNDSRIFGSDGSLDHDAQPHVQHQSDASSIDKAFDHIKQAIPSGFVDASPNTISAPSSLAEPVLSSPVALYYYVPADPDVADMRFMWPVDEEVSTPFYTKPPARRRPVGSSISPPSLSDQVLPYSSVGWPTLPSPKPDGGGMVYTPASSSNASLPSPYLNHLQLVGESCFAATLSIAQCLGISRPSYINDHPSPFTASSNSTVHTIPADLRPSGYQLILAHPCYLDCIPFPHFRSMAVYLSSVKKLDHCSLFLDLMHDGLVCWGRTRASGRHGRSMRDGVAWSKRSWEARPWFWRKWSWIARMSADDCIEDGLPPPRVEDDSLDDEDGMLSGSQWWWSQQDTDDDGDFSETGPRENSTAESVLPPPSEEFGVILSRTVTCNVGIRNLADVVVWE